MLYACSSSGSVPSARDLRWQSVNRRGSRLSASLAAALLAVLVAAVGAGAAGHGRPARQVESFKVVIEGNNTAHRHFYENGEAGTCEVRVKGDFTERTVFLRGKGVTIEIERVRHGSAWQYKIKRIGHGKPDFTVVAKIDREATGLITKVPLKIGLVSLPCPPAERRRPLQDPRLRHTDHVQERTGLQAAGQPVQPSSGRNQAHLDGPQIARSMRQGSAHPGRELPQILLAGHPRLRICSTARGTAVQPRPCRRRGPQGSDAPTHRRSALRPSSAMWKSRAKTTSRSASSAAASIRFRPVPEAARVQASGVHRRPRAIRRGATHASRPARQPPAA